jgi:hypothetical protein
MHDRERHFCLSRDRAPFRVTEPIVIGAIPAEAFIRRMAARRENVDAWCWRLKSHDRLASPFSPASPASVAAM